MPRDAWESPHGGSRKWFPEQRPTSPQSGIGQRLHCGAGRPAAPGSGWTEGRLSTARFVMAAGTINAAARPALPSQPSRPNNEPSPRVGVWPGLAKRYSRVTPNTCSCLRQSAHEFQRPEQPALVTRWPAAKGQSSVAVDTPCSGTRSLCPECSSRAVWDCRALWIVDGVCLARSPRLGRALSPTDVPDNVPESHTAARAFPGPRQASQSDVPDYRPLSDGRVGRPGPPSRNLVWVMERPIGGWRCPGRPRWR
jgi:hypothetical protein